mgnify:CR=1 FL=1
MITCAAYLRCLYASIEYAPSQILKEEAIKNIKDKKVFDSITHLCDACNWDDDANIGSKYLRVMRNIIKMPLEKGEEDPIMLY